MCLRALGGEGRDCFLNHQVALHVLLDPVLNGVQLVQHAAAFSPGFLAGAQRPAHCIQHRLTAPNHRVLSSVEH